MRGGGLYREENAFFFIAPVCMMGDGQWSENQQFKLFNPKEQKYYGPLARAIYPSEEGVSLSIYLSIHLKKVSLYLSIYIFREGVSLSIYLYL